MFFLRLLRFLCGYVKISVSGRFPERFLNMCANSRISVWYSHRRGENIECCIFARDYKRLPPLCRGCSVRVKILRKSGLPFITYRYRRRKGLVLGFAMCVAFVAFMPNFVWSINVNADDSIDKAQVLAALDEIGLSIGTPLNKVDTGNMRVQLALKMPQISWASINTDGTSITVDVRSAKEKGEKDYTYSNMVADFDGRITAVYVRSGKATVQVGDAVVKGQMLVSGTIEYKTGQTVFCHSDADVFAETNREISVSVPLKQTVTKDTGRVKKKKVLSLFSVEVPLYLGGVDFDEYRVQKRKDILTLDSVNLPVWVASADFYEVEEQEITLKIEKAKKQCEEKLVALEKETLDGKEIVSRKLEFKVKNAEAILVAKYVCNENIARTEYINFDSM